MYSHDLQSKENKVPHNDEFRKIQNQNQNQVDNQKEIEKLIKRENEERRQQQNLLNHKRRRNESQIGNIRNIRNNRSKLNMMIYYSKILPLKEIHWQKAKYYLL